MSSLDRLPRLTRLTRLTLAAGVGVVALAACGGDDDSGSAEGFCDSLLELENSGVDPDTDFDGAIGALEDVKSNSPGDLQDDVQTFIDVLISVDEAPEDAPFEDFEDAFADLTEAVENIQTYADENCEGLPEELFS